VFVDATDVCGLAEIIYDLSVFQVADGTLIEHGTVPTNYAMVGEDCSPHCLFQVHHTGTFIEDTEFTIKLSQLEDWVRDVKRIVRAELDEIEARLSKRYGVGKVKRCLPPGYFWLRFGQGNQNLLSTSTGSEDVVYVQWTHLHSALIPNSLTKQSSIAETVEQLTLCKYKGRPHWGKNHERVFRHPECKVRDNFPAENIEQLLAMQQQHDPAKLFEPELFKHLLERTGPEYSQLCTPHFWCYCRDDSHCPSGHACRSSASFPKYKVCKFVEETRTHEQDIAEL
jgi:L-gulonolactone oxidase